MAARWTVTSGAGGRHLGDRALEPLRQEMDARAAVVVVPPRRAPDAPRSTAGLDEHPRDAGKRHAVERGDAEVLVPRLAGPAPR